MRRAPTIWISELSAARAKEAMIAKPMSSAGYVETMGTMAESAGMAAKEEACRIKEKARTRATKAKEKAKAIITKRAEAKAKAMVNEKASQKEDTRDSMSAGVQNM